MHGVQKLFLVKDGTHTQVQNPSSGNDYLAIVEYAKVTQPVTDRFAAAAKAGGYTIKLLPANSNAPQAKNTQTQSSKDTKSSGK